MQAQDSEQRFLDGWDPEQLKEIKAMLMKLVPNQEDQAHGKWKFNKSQAKAWYECSTQEQANRVAECLTNTKSMNVIISAMKSNLAVKVVMCTQINFMKLREKTSDETLEFVEPQDSILNDPQYAGRRIVSYSGGPGLWMLTLDNDRVIMDTREDADYSHYPAEGDETMGCW